MPTYPELAAFDSTSEQALGLQIAFKLAVNQQQTDATTPGAFALDRVTKLFDDYAAHHVVIEQKSRLDVALETASLQKKQEVAEILGVDLTIEVPPDKPAEPIEGEVVK